MPDVDDNTNSTSKVEGPSRNPDDMVHPSSTKWFDTQLRRPITNVIGVGVILGRQG
jgi:hypothetical protein